MAGEEAPSIPVGDLDPRGNALPSLPHRRDPVWLLLVAADGQGGFHFLRLCPRMRENWRLCSACVLEDVSCAALHMRKVQDLCRPTAGQRGCSGP